MIKVNVENDSQNVNTEIYFITPICSLRYKECKEIHKENCATTFRSEILEISIDRNNIIKFTNTKSYSCWNL